MLNTILPSNSGMFPNSCSNSLVMAGAFCNVSYLAEKVNYTASEIESLKSFICKSHGNRNIQIFQICSQVNIYHDNLVKLYLRLIPVYVVLIPPYYKHYEIQAMYLFYLIYLLQVHKYLFLTFSVYWEIWLVCCIRVHYQ